MKCIDCGIELTSENAPPGGWELEDGRTVCTKCCAKDLNQKRLSYRSNTADTPFIVRVFQRFFRAHS